jgi:uncharacterized LabA/DUF88 family protein
VQGFTEGEITQTVHSLAKGTVGPEGFPAEFYQKYWAIIKTDIINLINAFHKNELDLWRLNRASIILIPKKQGANKLEEFRPISVIPGIIKIISKLMAQRLQKAMSSLIDIHQTAFIPGRSLMKTFLVVREYIHFRNKNHIPSVALKIDFRKADYLPVLQKIQARLAGGQNTTLSLAGRKVLVNSVINALPLHYMQVFLLPQWLIKHIERTKRAFFWKGKGKCIGGHCLVNWTRVCLPIEHGGMGIRDLKIQNISLLLKWLWNLRTNQNSL